MKILCTPILNSSLVMAGLALACCSASFAAPVGNTAAADRIAVGAAAPGGTASDSTVSAPDVDPNSYLIAPFDQLDIYLAGQDTMHRTVTVLQDGTFNYPVVGSVKASGMTVAQLTTALEKGLSEMYNQPQVTVTMLSTHTRQINVTGAVKSPGEYPYRPGLHLLELISACGGPTGSDELTQATLITDHGQKSTSINLVKLVQDGDQTQNFVLSPGDSLLFSPKDPATSTIHVIGQVQKPGDYGVVTNGATVLAMLTEAGGPTNDAALSQAQILKGGNGAGEGKIETVDLHALKYNLKDPAGRIKLAAGDTLLIPENNNKIYVIGETRNNTVMLIPDGETLTVTQALASAGGVDDNGDKKQVGIIRKVKTKTGTETKFMEVNVASILKGNGDTADTPLEPGDTLVVPTRRHGHSIGDYLGAVSQAALGALYLRGL